MRPKILFIATGGTVALDASTGDAAGHRSGERLLADLDALDRLVEPVVLEVAPRRSSHMAPGDMRDLAARIHEHAGRCDGVVLTHGTDTIEETAYGLALMAPSGLPIVLTGAMRRRSDAGADGPANVLAAFRVAAEPALCDTGPVVVMGDEIHAARDVTKRHTSAIAAFASPGLGPLGRITEDRVELLHAPTRREGLGLPAALTGRVELVWAAAGSDGALVAAAASIADGLVVAGMGGGHLPAAMAAAAIAATARMPVVLTSRCGAGTLLRATYEGEGSEQALLEGGLLDGGALSPVKARLRLLVALALGVAPATAFPT